MNKTKSENIELLTIEPGTATPLATRTTAPANALAGVNIEALLAKAVDAKSAVEVIERLQVLRKELRAEQAKEAFDAALAAFQAECPIIQKTRAGAKDAYRYAPLDHIVGQVRDLLRQHGFSYSVTSEIEEKWVKAICRVTHQAGHSEVSAFKVPIDSRNTMMNDPQRYAGSMTFAKRYAFCNAFGILTADEDKDGATGLVKPAGPSAIAPDDARLRALAKELWNLLLPVVGKDQKDWQTRNDWLWKNDILDGATEPPEAAPHLSAERFQAVLAKVKEELR